MAVLLFLIFFGIGFVCVVSIQKDVAQKMHKPLNSLDVRYAIDAYIWANDASKSLRQRGIVVCCCLILGFLSLAYIGWFYEPQTAHNKTGAGIAIIAAILSAGKLAWEILRQVR